MCAYWQQSQRAPECTMLLSKSQAQQVAALLNKSSRSQTDGLIRCGYLPGRGIVVDVIKNDTVVEAIGETGAPLLLDGLQESTQDA